MSDENKSKAYEFDEIASGPFLPIYPVIAQQIVEKTGINKGVCLDIGSGGGHLGLSIFRITDMHIILLDKLAEALTIAAKRVRKWGAKNRVATLLGDAQAIPLQDNTVDLCVSRGSVWFWEDQKMGFLEIYRVLKAGGMAYIGGGFGNRLLKEQVDRQMKKRDSEWPGRIKKFTAGNTGDHFSEIMHQLDIHDFEITDDETGLWVMFKKG